jgi:uncharacterized protein YbjQ (UPF0145 family)
MARIPATGCNAGPLGALEQAGWEVSGLVCGAAVHHVGLVGWPAGNAEVTALSSTMYEAREQALAGLRGQATALGADGVIDTRIDIHFMKDHRHLPRFVAVGTAIRRRRPTPDRPPSSSEAFVTPLGAMELIRLAEAGYRPLGIAMGSCVYHVARRGFAQWATDKNRPRHLSSCD